MRPLPSFTVLFVLFLQASLVSRAGGHTGYPADSLPLSEINIPVRISLRPLNALAEKSVDTLFTSPGYPDDWVQEGCDVRYKYIFRRSPLQLSGSGNTLTLGFTGFYKIIGSTRACVRGVALSPWTPPCKCGFSEPERRVNVSFTNRFQVQPDYKVRLQVIRNEPKPLDKCEVCFWGQDITGQVMKGLKEELDAAKKDLDKQYSVVDLRPRIQQLWNQLSQLYSLYGLGWLQLNPERLRINNLFIRQDSLHLYLGLTARPVIRFEKPAETSRPLPNLGPASRQQGFSLFLDAVLHYDTLTALMNENAMGQQFDFKKGFIRKKFIIDSCRVAGSGEDKLLIRVHFSGTNRGVFLLTGRPAYDTAKKLLEVQDIDFDIKSKNLLLGSADWLFDKKITRQIAQYARFEMASYIDSAKATLASQLNREWVKGIYSSGSIRDIRLAGFYPLEQHMVVRSYCGGELAVRVESIDFSL